MKVLRNSFLFCLFLFSVIHIGSAQLSVENTTADSLKTILPQSLYHYQIPEKKSNQQFQMRSPYEHWGFICKWELQNDMNKSQIPVRVRLGTLDYVNRLESGKP